MIYRNKILPIIIFIFLGACSNYDYFVKTTVAPKSPAYKITVVQENNNGWWADSFSRGLFYTELLENGFQVVESGNKVFSGKGKNLPSASPIAVPEPASSEQFIYDIEFIRETGRSLNVDMILFIHINPAGANMRYAAFKLVKTADGSVVSSTTAMLNIEQPKENYYAAKLIARDIRNALTAGKTVVSDYGRPNGE